MKNSVLTLGHRLRQRRWDDLRLRQCDLAAAVGVSPGYLSDVEHDRARVTAATWRRLALALGLEEFTLVTQAVAEGPLAGRMGHPGRAEGEPVAPTPMGVPPPPPRPMPTKPWLTMREAATVIAMSPTAIRRLVRAGRLHPAHRVHVPGRKGHRAGAWRWRRCWRTARRAKAMPSGDAWTRPWGL